MVFLGGLRRKFEVHMNFKDKMA